MKVNQCIIIGGGNSIPNSKELWNKLENRFTVGINYSYHFIEPTILCYTDYWFQEENEDYVKKHELVVSRMSSTQFGNSYLYPDNKVFRFNRKLSEGCYYYWLCGLFSLNVAMKILKEGEIYLLGFDLKTEKTKDGIKNNFHGYNPRQVYNYNDNTGRDNDRFKVFKTVPEIKIFNVNPESNLECFDKISYTDFYDKLDNNLIRQSVLRNEIKEILRNE